MYVGIHRDTKKKYTRLDTNTRIAIYLSQRPDVVVNTPPPPFCRRCTRQLQLLPVVSGTRDQRVSCRSGLRRKRHHDPHNLRLVFSSCDLLSDTLESPPPPGQICRWRERGKESTRLEYKTGRGGGWTIEGFFFSFLLLILVVLLFTEFSVVMVPRLSSIAVDSSLASRLAGC